MSEENIYGEGAVTGSADDALKALEGRDVDIKATNTTQIVTGDTTEPPAKADEKVKEEAPESPDAIVEAEVQNAIKADADAKETLSKAGIDFDSLAAEFETNGTLSPESLTKLESAGFPKSVVDAYIAGMAATAEKFTNTVMGYAGGEEGFKDLTRFVQSMGLAQVKVFNDVVQTGNLGQIRAVMDGFMAKKVAAEGKNPDRLILGEGNVPNNAPVGFASKAEMVKAMSDARYARDPAYTREVEAKLVRSKFL